LSSKKPKQGYKLVKSLFGKTIEIPENWDIETAEEHIELKHGHQFGENDYVSDSGIKLIKIGQLGDNGMLDLSEYDLVRPTIAKEFVDYFLKEGDILMSLTGYIGRVIRIKINGKLLQNGYQWTA